jgi:hypothetical protein
MRILPFLLLMIAISFSASMAQKEFKPTLTNAKQIVFDFRADRTSTPAKISPATRRMVLAKVFRKYLTDSNQCNPQFEVSGDQTDLLKAARDAGQMVPDISDMATGSFTAPGQSQTAYVISVSECNASHADNYGTKRVAIFSGQQLVADVDADYRNGVLLKMDLNSDGIDELLMTAGDMNQGILIENAALVDFQNGRFRTVQEFGTVIEDSCGSGTPDSSSKAAVLSISNIEPGKMPRLKMENYVASCRNPRRWRFLSTGKMP